MERLLDQPILTWLRSKMSLHRDVLLASSVANILALAVPLYSMQVMNRYISIGVDATLLTLTVGALIGLAAEYYIRKARYDLCAVAAQDFEHQQSQRLLQLFSESQLQSLERVQPNQRRELFSGLGEIQQAYSAGNIGALYDAPFTLLFVLVLLMLSPYIGVGTVAVCALMWWLTLRIGAAVRTNTAEVSQESARFNGLTQFLLGAGDMVRAMRFQEGLAKMWDSAQIKSGGARQRLQIDQATLQQITFSMSTLLTIVVYFIGAKLVVAGKLDTGSLIGASILASRAISGVARLAQLALPLERARLALQQMGLAEKLPKERDTGIEPVQCEGRLQLHDVSFAFAGQPMPLFESLNLVVLPGQAVAICGPNGSGKTTLARLFLGLIEPERGQYLIENVEVRQVLPDWWRSQVMYVPQEPQFFEGSLRDNLLLGKPDIGDEVLLEHLRTLRLNTFIEQQKEGFEMQVRAGGSNLPLGIRRRLAYVRALLAPAQVAIIDEPLEAVDPEGSQAIAALLNEFTRAKKTLVLCSNDAFIANAAHIVVNLGVKPVPEIKIRTPSEGVSPAAPAAAVQAVAVSASAPAAATATEASVPAAKRSRSKKKPQLPLADAGGSDDAA